MIYAFHDGSGSVSITAKRKEEYPSLNLATPSMVSRESEASGSTIPVPLAAYDAPGIPPLSRTVVNTVKLTRYFPDAWECLS